MNISDTRSSVSFSVVFSTLSPLVLVQKEFVEWEVRRMTSMRQFSSIVISYSFPEVLP
jgi:hypothetical protein